MHEIGVSSEHEAKITWIRWDDGLFTEKSPSRAHSGLAPGLASPDRRKVSLGGPRRHRGPTARSLWGAQRTQRPLKLVPRLQSTRCRVGAREPHQTTRPPAPKCLGLPPLSGLQSGFPANRILQLEDPRKAAPPSRVCWARTQTRSRMPWGRGLRPGDGRSLVSSPRCSQPLPLPRAPGLRPPGLWTRIRSGASPGWSPLPSRS